MSARKTAAEDAADELEDDTDDREMEKANTRNTVANGDTRYTTDQRDWQQGLNPGPVPRPLGPCILDRSLV